MPKVSVIIPCYNVEAYIGNCLEKLISQEYKDFDIYCVDDCSTDSTRKIIEQFQNNHDVVIYYLKNDANLGPALSRNKAINATNSEFVAFCDADDWYDKEYLKLMVRTQESQNADIVVCGYKSVFPNGTIRRHPVISSNEEVSNNALIYDIDSLWVLFVRRQLFLRFPIPDIRNGEDMAVIPLLLSSSNKVNFVDSCPYNYVYHSNSLSVTSSKTVVKSLILSFEHICQNISQKHVAEIEFRGINIVIYGALLTLFKCSFDMRMAEEILNYFERDFPNWINNRYLNRLPFAKRLFVKFAYKRKFMLLKVYSELHKRFILWI